jgi:hypothetical protein
MSNNIGKHLSKAAALGSQRQPVVIQTPMHDGQICSMIAAMMPVDMPAEKAIERAVELQAWSMVYGKQKLAEAIARIAPKKQEEKPALDESVVTPAEEVQETPGGILIAGSS